MTSLLSDKLELTTPSADEVRIQLDRVLGSERLHLPERARKFLRFVVDETLAGRSQYLKAYTIAEMVFGRKNFDAQSDPAVRIEAGRIRRELERYYLIAGPDEPVVISIPKGGYVPSFRKGSPAEVNETEGNAAKILLHSLLDQPAEKNRSHGTIRWPIVGGVASCLFLGALSLLLWELFEAPASAGDGRPTIVVDAFEYPPEDADLQEISQGMTNEVIAKLVMFKEIIVVDGTAEAPEGTLAEARYALQSSLRKHGERIRSDVRLIRRADGAVIWADSYDGDLRVQSPFETESAVAAEIATSVARPFGIMFQDETSKIGGWEAYDCALSYYSYRRKMTMEALSAAQACLAALTRRYPKDATSLGFLSLTYLDQVRFSYKLRTKPSKELADTAFRLAQRASAVDPQNPRALQALMLTSFFQGDQGAALEAGSAAYELNPNDTEVVGEYGLRLAMAGYWDSGCGLISKAVSRDAGPSGYYEVGMALCAFMKGDLQAAELWSRMSDLDYNPMHRIVLMAILGASAKTELARKELESINAASPQLMPNIKREVAKRLSRAEDQERILSGLRAGGAIIAETPAYH